MVGPFWPPERNLVEQFADLPFPFHKIDVPKFEMTAQWNLDHLLGYLQTWSSTQRFIAAHASNPLEQIIDELRGAWGDSQQTRNVTWPLVLPIGIKTSGEGMICGGTEHSRRARRSRPTNFFLRSCFLIQI